MAKSLEKFFISKVKTLPDSEYVIESDHVVKSATVKPKIPKPVTSTPIVPPSGPALQVMIDKLSIAGVSQSSTANVTSAFRNFCL